MPKRIRRIDDGNTVPDDAPSDSFFIGMVDGKLQKIRVNNAVVNKDTYEISVYTVDEDGNRIDAQPIIEDEKDEEDYNVRRDESAKRLQKRTYL
jgi:hypothetical protein